MKRPRLRRPRLSVFPGEDLEYGTVPYHAAMARGYRKLSWFWIGLAAMYAWVWQRPPHFFWESWVFVGMAFFCGRGWHDARGSAKYQAVLAWQVETRGIGLGMAAAGIYDFPDFIRALRDGPPPPGLSVKEWRDTHDEILRRIAEEESAG